MEVEPHPIPAPRMDPVLAPVPRVCVLLVNSSCRGLKPGLPLTSQCPQRRDKQGSLPRPERTSAFASQPNYSNLLAAGGMTGPQTGPSLISRLPFAQLCPSCRLGRGRAELPGVWSAVISASPGTLWLLCQHLAARPGSAGLWSLEPAGPRREGCQMCANKWQELLCNYSGTEMSRGASSPTGCGIQRNRGSTQTSLSETEPLHFGLFSSWHEAFVSCLKGEGFQSGLSRT